MFKSLRSRLILSYLFVLLVSGALIALALILLLRNNPAIVAADQADLNMRLQRLRRENPEMLREIVENAERRDDREQLIEDFADMLNARVLIVQPNGNVSMDSYVISGERRPDDVEKIIFRPLAVQRDRNNPPGTFVDSSNRRWAYSNIATIGNRQGGNRNQFEILIAKPVSSPPQYAMENFLMPLAIASIVAAFFGLIFALLIGRSVAAPLRKLAAATDKVAQGNYDQEVTVSGPTEVRQVATSFNNMVERVEASQTAQRDFVANVSHELKTPLTSIQGYSQAIKDDFAEEPETAKRFATIINDEADRMHRMVVQLLDLARWDSNQTPLQPLPMDVAPLLNAILMKVQPQANEKSIQLSADIKPLPQLTIDGDRINQVLTNLMANAIKYTPDGGRVRLSAWQENGVAKFAVDDTGQGIPEEDLPRIFERFYRVDKSRKGNGAETTNFGLGLAISQEIVKAHGGEITAQSVVGRGTRFLVQLPIQ